MNKKIIFLMLILLSISIDVKATGITINNRYYNATSDIVGNGFKYSVSDKTLELNNYKGSTISTLDDLCIIIKGDNYLTSNSTLPLIKAKNLVIIGEGSLNVTAPGIAFYADSIEIKNIVVKGSSKTEFISVTNSFSLDNVKIDVESGTTLLYGGSNNTINNSVINSNNKWGLRYAKNGNTIIENSDITMECSSICINSTATLSFDKTKALFHGKTCASSNIKISFSDSASYLISYDGISYQESSTYNNFPYLKINGILEDDIDKDDDMKEDNVNDNDSSGNNDTSDTNKDNNSPSNDSTSNDDNFDKPNDNHNEGNNGNSINKEETDEDKATNDNELKDDSHENNDSNINQGDESNLGDNNFNNDLGKEDSDDSTDDVYTNSEYENDDEIYTDNEYDNDWTVEVENPKTYDGIGYKVFWLTFSLAGIIAFAFLMRYLNGKI